MRVPPVFATFAVVLALPVAASAQATGTITYDAAGAGISTLTLGGTPQVIVSAGGASGAAWSPNGATLAYQLANIDIGGTAVMTQPAAGGAATTITTNGSWPQFSPNGNQLSYVTDGLVVVPVGGGTANQIVAGTSRIGGSSVLQAVWAPSGSRLLYTLTRNRGAGATAPQPPAQVASVAATGGRPTTLRFTPPTGWRLSGGLSVSPTGSTIALTVTKNGNPATASDYGIVFAPAGGGRTSAVTTGYFGAAYSPDGSMLCATQPSANLSSVSLAILSSSGALLQQTGVTGDNCTWQP